MQVSWWNGTHEISNAWHWKVEHENGTGSAKSEINLNLNRFNLARTLTCRVNSSAIPDRPMTTSVVLDMNLAPNELEMTPQTRQVDEGGKVQVRYEYEQVYKVKRAKRKMIHF